MESVLKKPQQIDKNIIQGFPFVREDVLLNDVDLKDRLRKLMRALQLGNLHKQHVHLRFKHENGETYETHATVWAVTERYVVLKGGVTIPIHSIYEIELV